VLGYGKLAMLGIKKGRYDAVEYKGSEE